MNYTYFQRYRNTSGGDKLGGRKHRRMRQQLAASASRLKDAVLTTKFPLERPESGWGMGFEQACALYNITDGIGKGSLTGLLTTAHLSGFALFDSAGKTRLHRSGQQLPTQAFCHAFEGTFGLPANEFAPANLINFFAKERRGKNNKLVISVCVKNLYELTGERLSDKTEYTDFLACCEALAQALQAGYKDWAAIKQDVDGALAVIDKVLTSYSKAFPSLCKAHQVLKPLSPAKTSIDHSVRLLTASDEELNDGYELHRVIAQKCHALQKEEKPITAKAVQALITTSSFNALSWLFGTGLNYWQTSDLETICCDYGLDDEQKPWAKRVKNYANAIEKDPLFGTSYANYRNLLGGKLDSWVSNYLSRLVELETLLAGIKKPKPLYLA